MECKICSDCKRKKNRKYFSKQRKAKDGLQSRCKKCERKYRQSDKGKETRRKYIQNNKDKISARNILASAIRYGKMEREPCHCGETKVQAHHENYSNPLDVEWLCEKHHK